MRRFDEVADLMETIERLPDGHAVKDSPAYTAVAQRKYVRVPRIIPITLFASENLHSVHAVATTPAQRLGGSFRS